MHFRLIHPTAGVVAEFASADVMIRHFVERGRKGLEASSEGMMLQVSQGGLYFQEFLDASNDSDQIPIDGNLFRTSTRLMQ